METTKPTIYEALSKAQASFKSALKDANNPFFKSKYAPMSSIWDACKEGLAANGLFVSQPPAFIEGVWVVQTKIYNSTGESIECTIPIIVKPNANPQEFGSALTYARRYSLSSILGIVTDDDDAEAATATSRNSAPQKEVKVVTIKALLDTIEGATSTGEVVAIWDNNANFRKDPLFIGAIKTAGEKFKTSAKNDLPSK